MPVAPAPAVPDVSGMGMSDLANLIQTAPDLATRQAALTAMRAGPEEAGQGVLLAKGLFNMFNPKHEAFTRGIKNPEASNYSGGRDPQGKAKGGVIRYQEGGRVDMAQTVATDPAVIAMANRMGMSVQQYLENLDPEARRQFVRNAERRANMDLSEDDAAYEDSIRGAAYLELPSQGDLDSRYQRRRLGETAEELGLSGIPSSLGRPSDQIMVFPDTSRPDTDTRAAGRRVYPDGRGNTAPYPTPPSRGATPAYPNEAVPEGLGLEGVINLDAATLGSGEMAAGHPLPDRLLNIPGAEEPVDRGRQYVGAVRNLVGLSDEGRAMPAQLAAEDVAMAQPILPRGPSLDTTDDARAARGLSRSPFLSGLEDPGSGDDIRSLIRPAGDAMRAARRSATDEVVTSPMAMSAGEIGAPRPSMVPEFVTDPDTPMDRAARESAEEAATLRDEAGIEESLRTPEDQAAAAAAARAGVAAPAGQTAPTGAGGGAGGMPGATGVPANAEMSENERMFNQDKWLALARVGLGLMASQAPTFGQALGEAGMAGVDALASAREDYLERKQAEELMSLRRAAVSARGAGGGGGAMPGLTFDLSAGEGRALERLDNEIMAVENQILNMGEEPSTGFLGLGGPDAQWVMEREQLENRRRVLEAARDAQLSRLVTAGLGGSAPVATEASAPYSITDVR